MPDVGNGCGYGAVAIAAVREAAGMVGTREAGGMLSGLDGQPKTP
jgi:hypothetical protein